MCFDFRRARSHPLAPTSHRPLYPGRSAMYTAEEGDVKATKRRLRDQPQTYWLSAILMPLRGTT